MQNIFFFHFSLFIYLLFIFLMIEKNNKNNLVWDAWMLCNADPKKTNKAK